MFDRDFYPTPKEVIHEMIAPYYLYGKTVLEPSAGKGDIIDVLKEQGANVVCCEKNPDLARIVSEKAKLIATNFMFVKREDISHVNYIVMNPPFSKDAEHILHAWEIAPDGCEIVALCNYETVNNSYSITRRELASIVRNYGFADNMGDVFSNAERKTNVDVGIIRLTKPASQDTGFDDFFTDEEDEFERHENGIMSYNAVRDVVQRYVNALKLYDEVLENAVKMNRLTEGLHVKDLVFTCKQDDAPTTRDEFAKELQKKCWAWIISKMDLTRYSTRGLIEDINKFVEQQKSVKFTMKNIYRMFDVIYQTTGQRMDKALLEVFDDLTKHTHGNRWNVEGWKTNSHYLVNKKFIKDYVAPYDYYGRSVSHRTAEVLDDLDKALCLMQGYKWDNYRRFYNHVYNLKPPYGEWFDWGFFEVKLFKKGTGHFKFKDENVWAMFNQRIAKIKGFTLPENMRV